MRANTAATAASRNARQGGGRRRIRITPLRILLALLLVSGIALGGFGWAAASWTPARADFPVQGVALSAANGPVDWSALAGAEVDFIYLLAGEGSDRRDPGFAASWAGARDAGLRRGAIFRFSLCRLASDQAQLFLATVPRDGTALPPVVALDFQADCVARPGRDLILSELNVLLNALEVHGGKPAILRISPAFEQRYRISEAINRTVWLDRDLFQPTYAAHDWVLWTANHRRRIQGVAGTVDWTVARP